MLNVKIIGDITPSYVSPQSLCNRDFRGVVLSLLFLELISHLFKYTVQISKGATV